MISEFFRANILVVCALLVACGGGSGDGNEEPAEDVRTLMEGGYYTFQAKVRRSDVSANYSHHYIDSTQDRVIQIKYEWDNNTLSWDRRNAINPEYQFYTLKDGTWEIDRTNNHTSVYFDEGGAMIYRPSHVEIRLNGVETVDLSGNLINEFVDIDVIDAPHPIDANQGFSQDALLYKLDFSFNETKYILDDLCDDSSDSSDTSHCELITQQLFYFHIVDLEQLLTETTFTEAQTWDELFEGTTLFFNNAISGWGFILREDGTINFLDLFQREVLELEGKWAPHQIGDITIYQLEIPLLDREEFNDSHFLTVYDGKLVWGNVVREGEMLSDSVNYFNTTAIDDIRTNFNP